MVSKRQHGGDVFMSFFLAQFIIFVLNLEEAKQYVLWVKCWFEKPCLVQYLDILHVGLRYVAGCSCILHYIILNNGILKSNSTIFPQSEGYITQYTP